METNEYKLNLPIAHTTHTTSSTTNTKDHSELLDSNAMRQILKLLHVYMLIYNIAFIPTVFVHLLTALNAGFPRGERRRNGGITQSNQSRVFKVFFCLFYQVLQCSLCKTGKH